MAKLTHINDKGEAHMVDVGDKATTKREAVASATVSMGEEAFRAVREGVSAKKGDIIAASRIAGIMAAKKTSELIPLCHPISLDKVTIDFAYSEDASSVTIRALCRTEGKTGVEMEAMTAASVAALTLYDMIKSMDQGACITTIVLERKSGGKSDYKAP